MLPLTPRRIFILQAARAGHLRTEDTGGPLRWEAPTLIGGASEAEVDRLIDAGLLEHVLDESRWLDMDGERMHGRIARLTPEGSRILRAVGKPTGGGKRG